MKKALIFDGKIENISVTSTGTAAITDKTQTGTIVADKLGTVTVSSEKGAAEIGAVTVAGSTTDFTDGTITSLNASVSAGIVMYEVVKQRKIK